MTSAMAGLLPPAHPIDRERPVVLLVEDDDGDALLVRELLADGFPGAQVHWARTLGEAKQLAMGADCALLDLGLPDTSGPDGVARLLADAGHLAVVVLTGADSDATGDAALAAGAQDYLVKSRVDTDSLTRSIRYALERRRATEAARRLADAERRRRENARMERALLRPPLVHSDTFTLVIRYRPARDGAELGGDFYDAIECTDGRLHVIVGDVAGHGADEAALGARLRSAWRALALADLHPDTMLATLEAVLRAERDDDSMFATICQASIDAGWQTAELRLAGHPAPLLIARNRVAAVPGTSGVLLGPFPGTNRPTTTVALTEPWALLLFTDGLIEGKARPGSDERLGSDAVAAILQRLVDDGLTADDLIDALLEAVEDANGGPLGDDIALCLIEHHSRD
jgi:serine phosphatase RsbU (regulator of sigma subunit)